MSQYQVDMLFGGDGNPSLLPANMMNQFAASDGGDWNSVIANGIRGAADQAIKVAVQEKFADGQLVNTTAATSAATSPTGLLILAALAFLVLQ